MKSIHLVCNAHLDPVWLWEWEEGAAEAISTFRVAADFCEEFNGFVFNHNEAMLYQWVEEYEPTLFRRIQKLVKQGKWHIMGGWYLQPDCNMPSGESFVRQILLARQYFYEKFGVTPTVAINFDPFGHTRGLVQILAKSGYEAYIFCRPEEYRFEKDEFIWEGYDGSRVLAVRAFGFYLSQRGRAREKAERLMKECTDSSNAILLWGVGNHGGGPSRVDIRKLAELMSQRPEVKIRHSTPEAYVQELKQLTNSLPVHRKDLNPWAVGSYTSQIRIKQNHRLLENELYSSEKMATAAWCQKLMPYPKEELQEAMRDLATSEFHDILPGSAIQPVEKTSLRLMDHALEILSRVKARAFFALAKSQPKAKKDEIPILVYNPHPFPVKTTIECEFQLADQNRADTFTQVTVYRNGKALATQVEKELSNLNLDWRKRVIFAAELAPSQMNRFDCRLAMISRKPQPKLRVKNNKIHLKTNYIDVIINTRTGLIDRYRVGEVDCLSKGACRFLVFFDDEDPWGMRVRRFRRRAGIFKLLSQKDSARFSGVRKPLLPSVRVIEDGPVRAVVESVFGYGDSHICQRYKLPKQGVAIEVEFCVHWNEKDRMLKLSLPTPDREAMCRGQIAYGSDALSGNGDETIIQKWVAVVSRTSGTVLTVINDGIYGADFLNGELRLSLLRSPAYSAHPIYDRSLVPQDRYTPRVDQGERLFRFWINAGPADKRLEAIDREALIHNEKPMVLPLFPAGSSFKPKPFVTLSDSAVQVTALKKAEYGNGLIVRLFEPTGHKRKTLVSLPFAEMKKIISLNSYEIRTYLIDIKKRTWTEVDLMERPV